MSASMLASDRVGSLVLAKRKAAIAISIGFTATLSAALIGPADMLPASALLAFTLSWAAMVDIDRFILPDALTLGLILAGLGLALARGLPEALPFVIGAAAGYGSLAGIAAIYSRLRGRSGLGLGDAKLLAVAGAWLGWTALPLVLLLASLSCIAVVALQAALRQRAMTSGPVPFGPYLAGALWVMWLMGAGGWA
jgi:leader peptidase (prepilin peptidase)/N-methyltransferase